MAWYNIRKMHENRRDKAGNYPTESTTPAYQPKQKKERARLTLGDHAALSLGPTARGAIIGGAIGAGASGAGYILGIGADGLIYGYNGITYFIKNLTFEKVREASQTASDASVKVASKAFSEPVAKATESYFDGMYSIGNRAVTGVFGDSKEEATPTPTSVPALPDVRYKTEIHVPTEPPQFEWKWRDSTADMACYVIPAAVVLGTITGYLRSAEARQGVRATRQEGVKTREAYQQESEQTRQLINELITEVKGNRKELEQKTDRENPLKDQE